MLYLLYSGLLHSDICGSILACNSPQLFAAYHVLHRLPMPRHSPCALFSLTIFFKQSLMLDFSCVWSFSKFVVLPHNQLSLFVRKISFCFPHAFLLCFIQFSRFCFGILCIPWWAQVDSNHRPHAYQACALTTWAMRPFSQYLGCSLSFSHVLWWRWRGSNSWPPACKAGALPAELHPH